MKTQNGKKIHSSKLVKLSEGEVVKAMNPDSNPVREPAVKMVLLEPEI